jgi:hypothetical protein
MRLLVITWKTWPKLPSPTFEPTFVIISLSICFPLLLRASHRGAEATTLGRREVRDNIGLANNGAGRKTSFGRTMVLKPIQDFQATTYIHVFLVCFQVADKSLISFYEATYLDYASANKEFEF